MQLVLGSGSTPRRQVLQQLGIPFIVITPDIDETAFPGEKAVDLVLRLSAEKALAVAKKTQKSSIIIACDQVLACEDKHFGKPYTYEGAYQQLTYFSGRTATFYSGLSVYNQMNGEQHTTYCPTQVKFKHLSEKQIHHYITQTQPFHCAGSFMSERLGIALVDYMRSDDPYAILGLPLTQLCGFLQDYKLDPLLGSLVYDT